MGRSEMLGVLTHNLGKILEGARGREIDEERSTKELGADCPQVVEVVSRMRLRHLVRFLPLLAIACSSRTVPSESTSESLQASSRRPTLCATTFAGPRSEEPTSVAIDSKNNVIVSGFYGASITIGATTLTHDDGFQHAFIAKVAPDCRVLWVKDIAGPSHSAATLAVGGSDDVYVAVQYSGTADWGAGPATTVEGEFDLGLFKLDPQGNLGWSKSFAQPGHQGLERLVAGKDGSLALGGTFAGALDLGDGAVAGSGVGKGGLFVAKLDRDGRPTFVKALPTEGRRYPLELALGPAGELTIGSSFDARMDFGSDALFVGHDEPDFFVMRLDEAGGRAWLKRGIGRLGTIALDGAGNLFVTAHARCLGVDCRPLEKEGPTLGKLGPDGELLASIVTEHAHGGLGVDAAGNAFLVGQRITTMDGIFLTLESHAPLLEASRRDTYQMQFGGAHRTQVVLSSDGAAFLVGSFDSLRLKLGEVELANASDSFTGGTEVFVAKLGLTNGSPP
jgi:hypothetical protein